MQLTKFQVADFLLALFAITWRGGAVIPLPSSDKSRTRMVEDMAQILTSCYGDRIRGVCLVGNSFDTLARTLSTQHSIPVVLFDTALFISGNVFCPEVQFYQKLQIIIMDASIHEDFTSTIQRNICNTIWWNNMATFYILSTAPNCANGPKFLFFLWFLNIPNGIVLCNQFYYGKRIILSSNPYTTHAPAVWKRFGVAEEINKHSFTVFYRLYEENKSVCVDLDFDKTNDLLRHEISVAGKALDEVSAVGMKEYVNVNRYISTIERVLHNIFCSLNATPKFMPVERIEDQRDTDMPKISYLMLNGWDARNITYPYRQTRFIIVSQFRGHKS